MRRLIEQLFGSMPREFATPQRRVVEDFEELIECIDEHNGLTDVFVSAYGFRTEERSYGDVLINKVIFDFDDAWPELVETHEWLDQRDVAHFVVFSGSANSGHLYVLCEPTAHQQSLEYFQRDIVVSGAGLRYCNQCGNSVDRDDASAVNAWRCPVCEQSCSDSDTSLVVDANLIGDPATCVRVPNTWHPRAERFAVPLKPGEIELSQADIYDIAKGQRDLELGDIVSGHKTPSIDQNAETAEQLYHSHDEKRRLVGFESDQAVLEEFEAEVAPADMMKDVECECLRSLITDEADRRTMPELGHRNRRYLIAYLVEKGYNPAEIAKFLRFVLDERKAKHSVVEEEQPVRIWRDGVKAPNKMTLRRCGLWREDCPEHTEKQLGATA